MKHYAVSSFRWCSSWDGIYCISYESLIRLFSYGNTKPFLILGVAVLLVSEGMDRKRSRSERIATSSGSSFMSWVTWSGSGTSIRDPTATITSRLWRKTLCRVSTHASWPRHDRDTRDPTATHAPLPRNTRHDRDNHVQIVKKNIIPGE